MSSRIPHHPSPGVQGVNTTGIFDKIGDVIGLKRPNSNPAKKLEALSLDYDFKHHQAEAAYAAVKGYYTALGASEGRVAHVKATPLSRNFTVDQLTAAIAEAQQDVARCRTAYDAALARSKAANRASNIARQHLRRAQIAYGQGDINPVTPKPIKGSADEVIARIKEEWPRIAGALRPRSEVKAALMAQGAARAKDARYRVSFGKNPSLSGPVVRVAAEPSGTEEMVTAPDVLSWICRFFPDALEADIDAALDAKYAGVELTLSERDKAKRLSELADELLEADRHRAQALWDRYAADPAASLDFPADMDVRAILGLAGKPVVLPEDDDRNPGDRG